MTNEILVIMSNSGSGIELALSKSKVTLRLDEETIENITKGLKREKVSDPSGLMDKLKNFMMTNVQKLFSKRIEFSLDEISGVELVDGMLKFTYVGKHLISFDNIKVSNSSSQGGHSGEEKPVLSTFDAEDARAFVEAFREAQTKYLEFIDS